MGGGAQVGPSAPDPWATFYRWEWFRRQQWLPDFREAKRKSCEAFARALEGCDLVLDCSCGFGLKTVVMKEMGLNVVGSDGCAYAVERARELARREGKDIEFFASTWEDLPLRTDLRFDGVFNDALSWIATRDEFEAALAGLRAVLKPGGVLVFAGAPEGAPPERSGEILEKAWRRSPRFAVEWTHAEGEVSCTSIVARERGEDYIDEHHLFLIDAASGRRLETATIRQPCSWHWGLLAEMFLDAGFSKLETLRLLPGTTEGGQADCRQDRSQYQLLHTACLLSKHNCHHYQ